MFMFFKNVFMFRLKHEHVLVETLRCLNKSIRMPVPPLAD